MFSKVVKGSLLSGAAGAALLIAGCGGSSGSAAGQNASIIVNGGAILSVGQANQSLSATASFRQIAVQINGGVQTGINIPAGIAIVVGEPLTVVREGSTLLQASFPDGPSPILVDGLSSGLVLDEFTGELNGYMGLPTGTYALQTNRADISGGNNLAQGIGQLEFVYRVEADGTSTFPVAFTGRLPAEGETMTGAYLELAFDPLNAFANGSIATLTIEHSGGTIFQERMVLNNRVTFDNFDLPGEIRAVRNIRIEVW